MGTHGCLKSREDKLYFAVGMAELVNRLTPKNIIVYGTSPDYIFKSYRENGINIITFESEIAQLRKKVVS